MPCAACRLLRRRCAPECIFAPYFPTDDPLQFEIVHRIFGANNAAKILKVVPESHRAEAAKTLVYEAYCRHVDPVYGTLRRISGMTAQLEGLEADLMAVKTEILKHRLIMQSSSSSSSSCTTTSPPYISISFSYYFHYYSS